MSVRIDHLKRMVNLQAESFEEIERKFEETNVQYLPTISPVHEGRTWRSSSFGVAQRPLYRASGLPQRASISPAARGCPSTRRPMVL